MKYKIGDKVRIINTKKGFEHRKEYIGQTVTVKRVNPNGERTYNEPHYSVKENIPFIFFESELASVPVNTQKIVITSDGTETLARLYDGNKVIKTATAKCSPEDTFDFETGARIAFDRLIESPLTKALKNLANVAVKCGKAICESAASVKKKPHVYKAGDKVKVKGNNSCHCMPIGSVVTLDSTFLVSLPLDMGWYVKEYKDRYIRECDFEPYKFKFEVGKQYAYNDCVIEITSARIDECNCRRYDYKEIKGNTGPIKNFTENSHFGIELKPYEPPKYYNGKVACVEKSASYMAYTVGKVYEFKDGRVKIDNGNIIPDAGQKPVSSVDEWNNYPDTYAKFIPFVE